MECTENNLNEELDSILRIDLHIGFHVNHINKLILDIFEIKIREILHSQKIQAFNTSIYARYLTTIRT